MWLKANLPKHVPYKIVFIAKFHGKQICQLAQLASQVMGLIQMVLARFNYVRLQTVKFAFQVMNISVFYVNKGISYLLFSSAFLIFPPLAQLALFTIVYIVHTITYVFHVFLDIYL